jgi:hypothetical protein
MNKTCAALVLFLNGKLKTTGTPKQNKKTTRTREREFFFAAR